MTAATTPGRAYRAYEAYVMVAPDDLEFPEWDELPGWTQEAIDAAVQAGIEAQPRRVPELGAVAYEAAENAPLRDEIDRLTRERDSLTGRVAELVTEGNQLRAELAATKTVLQETSRESSQRGAHLEQILSSPAELARWIEIHHGDHQEWVDELSALLPREAEASAGAGGGQDET